MASRKAVAGPSSSKRAPILGSSTTRKPTSGTVGRQASSASSSQTHQSAGQVQQSTQSRRGREDDETNIQVVVRVRGNEAGLVNPVLVTEDAHCSAISVLTVPSKCFEFNHVFGHDADQGMVFQNVISPVIEDVLAGFNCTVFAYGQTGTGKTHTMEGDLSPNMGTFAQEAGVIPRALYRIFHKLDAAKTTEYSVQVSYLELYNEELRDLLSVDPPTPLVAGAKGLQIFEDEAKGVFVKGVIDAPIIDAEDGLNLLRRGSQKRQIAATKCNEASSRSHSIFTLTIHIKETSSNGDKDMRVGKLNLVDLAGSENLGRSGAQGEHAQEAGNINKSLLALGRVINALIHPDTLHIPYRDSKLTRLLKESLGGCAKTCIIATVASDKSNMEETMSTLDYAHSAKSIRNRPELNSRTSRAGLLKDYVSDNVKLRRDLDAARAQQGHYVSIQTWTSMQEELDSAKAKNDELRRSSEVTESKMASLQEQFDQNKALLLRTQGEMKTVKTDNAEQAKELARLRAEVQRLARFEEEERTLRDAYQRSEGKLDKAARALQELLGESAADVEGLRAKLERKTSVEVCNRSVATECHQSLSSVTGALEASTIEFRTAHERFSSNLTEQLDQFLARQEVELGDSATYVTERLQDVTAVLDSLRSQQTVSQSHIAGVADSIDNTRQELANASSAHLSSLRSQCEQLTTALRQDNSQATAAAKANLAKIFNITLDIAKTTQQFIAADATRLQGVHLSVQQRADAEVLGLRAHVEKLSELLVKEKEKSKASIEDITRYLQGVNEERNRGLADAVASIQSDISTQEQKTAAFPQQHAAQIDFIQEAGRQHAAEVVRHEKLAKKQVKEGGAALDHDTHTLGQSLTDFRAGVDQVLEKEHKEVQGQALSLSKTAADLREEGKDFEQVQQGKLKRFTETVEGALRGAHSRMHDCFNTSIEASRAAAQSILAHHSTATAFSTTLANGLSGLREESRSYLVNNFKIDQPTGSTPRKREASTAPAWHLVPTKRSRALEQHRARTEAAEAEGITSLSLVYPESESGNLTRDEEDEELDEGQPFLGDETIVPGTQHTLAARPKASMQRDRRSASVISNASESHMAPARVNGARGGALRTLSNGNIAAALATSSTIVKPIDENLKAPFSEDVTGVAKGRPAPGITAPRNKRMKH